MPIRVTLDTYTILEMTGTEEEFLDLVDAACDDRDPGINEEEVIMALVDDLTATLRSRREAAGGGGIKDSTIWIQTWLRGKWKELGFYPVARYPVPGAPSPLHVTE